MRVLIVEDEERIIKYLAQSLMAEGFSVDAATDGISALEKARANDYDVITLDILLPGMNGYEVCRQLREDGVDTPILMLTAKDGEYDEADALEMGADDFLRKPFSLVVLVARLRALLRRSGHSSNEALSVGELVIDERSRIATREGRRLDLTTREFDLLSYLAANAGTALSKDQLLEHIWGYGFRKNANIVEVYIGYLRKKVDAPFAFPLIHTVRGYGYRLGKQE